MDHLDVFGTRVKVPSIKHHDTFLFMAKLYCDVLAVIDVHITLLRGRIVLRCTVCWHYLEYNIFINIHGCCFRTFSIRCSWIIYRSISFCWIYIIFYVTRVIHVLFPNSWFHKINLSSKFVQVILTWTNIIWGLLLGAMVQVDIISVQCAVCVTGLHIVEPSPSA